MFATELDELEPRYADRLGILHIRPAEAHHPASLRGRIWLAVVQRLLASDLKSIDRWYLCGPSDLVTTMRDRLASQGVAGRADTPRTVPRRGSHRATRRG
jgi:ferredoxin-NADP reductase